MSLDENRHQTLLRWGLIFAGWTGLAFLFSTPNFIQAVRTNQISAVWSTVVLELIYSYLWLALTPLVVWWGRVFRIEGEKKLFTLTIHLVTSVLFLFVHSGLFLLVSIPFGWHAEITSTSTRYTFVILAFAPVNVVFYWGIVIVDHAIDYYRRYQERELRASQLETQLATAELQVLKMQLHPHFLFNTLNTISALIHESPAEADEMITQLGDLLRMTLETAGVQEVSLAQELDFLKHYLTIEQTRFQDRLMVTMSIEPETLDAMVPSLIMQPLVENAIRHGIVLRPEARLLEIKSWLTHGRLCLRVADDGPGLSNDKLPLKEGVGLTNTRRRLQSLYGAEHDFSLQNSPLGGLVVELKIPFKTAAVFS
jgi:two-component system, LytTR family, sensor kinase